MDMDMDKKTQEYMEQKECACQGGLLNKIGYVPSMVLTSDGDVLKRQACVLQCDKCGFLSSLWISQTPIPFDMNPINLISHPDYVALTWKD